jgi:Cu-Zn family superoxide dismutase
MFRLASGAAGAFAIFALASAGTASASEHEASASLSNADGGNVGSVTLTETPNGTLVHAKLEGLPPGTHAIHVHAVGECEPPFKSAGGHFDPEDNSHGFLSEDGMHAGDLPNIHVPNSGALEVEMLATEVALDDELFDDDGAAIVIHEKADDYKTDPAGDAGDRIACGVIER